MRSALLRDGDRILVHPLLLFALYLLLAGHNRPGGGFVAGLVAAAAFVLRAQARGVQDALRLVWVQPGALLGAGLATAVLVSIAPLLAGRPFLDQTYAELGVPLFGVVKLTSALAFDIGVALIVIGMVSAIVASFGEEGQT